MTLFIIIMFLVCLTWGYLRMKCKCSEKVDNYLEITVVLILIIAAGFRDGLSGYRDYQNYIWAFQSKEEGSIEYTFILISYIAQWLGGENYYFLFLIYALLGVSLKYVAIRQLTPLVWISLAIYISYFYSLHELTQIRAGVASGIGLLSFKFIYERKIIPFVFLVLLASLFHTSAMLYLPLYLLDGDKIRWKYWGSVIVSVLLFYRLLADRILILFFRYFPVGIAQNKIEGYVERGSQGIDNVTFLSNMDFLSYFLLMIFVLFANSMQQYNKYFYLLLKVYILGFLVKLILGSVVPELGNRGSELLFIVSIILIPMLVYAIKPRIIGKLLVLLIGGAHLYYILYSWKIIP